MMNETMLLKGKLSITLVDEKGALKEAHELDNLIVTAGKNYLAGGVLGTISTPFVAMAIGTGVTAAAITDTTLQTELVRAAFTSSSTVNNVATMSNIFGAGVGTGAITEAGLLSNAVSGGTLLSHIVFSVINKGVLDTLTITWTITVG